MKLSFTKEPDPKPLDVQIARVMTEMTATDVPSDDYRKLMKLLERLTKIKAQTRRIPVSRDTVIAVAGNMLTVGMLLLFETRHAITSKNAFQQIGRAVRPS